MASAAWRNCRCGCPSCTTTIRVKEECSPFAAISGATVEVFETSTSTPVLASGTTNGSGEASIAVSTGVYWVMVSKSGCAATVRKEVTLTCDGLTELSLRCTAGVVTSSASLCCSGGAADGAAFTTVKSGVTVASGVVAGGVFRYPKSAGTGTYVTTIGPFKGCNGGSASHIHNFAAQICNNNNMTLSNIVLGQPAGTTCCNGKAIPSTLKFVDGLGAHVGGWGVTSFGPHSRASQPFFSTVLGWYSHNFTSAPGECLPLTCQEAYSQWIKRELGDSEGDAEVDYVLTCISGGFRLTATWRYSNHIAGEDVGNSCYKCGTSCTGICSGATYPDCFSEPVIGSVTTGYNSGTSQCETTGFPAGTFQRVQTYRTGGGFPTATATADWFGTIEDPSQPFTIPFTFPDPGWVFDGPVVGTPSPPSIQPPPPPGGATVMVMRV